MKIFLPLFSSLVLAISPVSAEMRTFTSADGRALEAELVDFANGSAVLKLANGSEVPVALGQLSAADQEYVDLWATSPERMAAAASKSAETTPQDFLEAQGYVELTFQEEKDLLFLEVILADRPHRFLFNQSLPYSYLDGVVNDVLGLQVKPLADSLTALNGTQVPIGETMIDFGMGPLFFREHPIRVANLEGTGVKPAGVQVDGIFGFDLLQSLGAVIDYSAKKIYLKAPAS